MKIIGLTGGLGSGKSTIADLFAKLDVPIIDTDVIARDIVTPHQPAYDQIIQHFGQKIIHPNPPHDINRQLLAKIIFNHPEDKQFLENLLHPIIQQQVISRIQALKIQNPSHPIPAYCIIVIPLLAENIHQYQNILEHIIIVETSKELQIQRVSARDKRELAEIEAIINQQASPETRRAIADHIIYNTGDLDLLKSEVAKLNEYFL